MPPHRWRILTRKNVEFHDHIERSQLVSKTVFYADMFQIHSGFREESLSITVHFVAAKFQSKTT